MARRPARKTAVVAGTAQMLANLQLADDVLRLRIDGLRVAQIAARLGVAETEVSRILADELEVKGALKAEKVGPARDLAVAQLDELFQEALTLARTGKTDVVRLGGIRECRGLIDQRSKLLGLNMPIQVEQRHILEEKVSDEMLREMMAAAADRLTVVGEGSAE